MTTSDELERIALALQMLAPNDAQFWDRRHAIICALRDLAQRGAHGGRRWWRNDKAGAE